MLELLADISALTPKITVKEVRDGGQRAPSFALARPGEQARTGFAGLPLGHEFTSLVLALLQVGGYPPKVDASSIDQARALEGELNFETYISLSCQNCPDVVQALNLLSVLNPRIRHTMIDGALFEQEVASRHILSVPAVYLNGELFGQGRMSLEEILAKLDTASAARTAARLNECPALRCPGHWRRTRRCFRRHLCRAQGHSRWCCRGTFRRAVARHPWHREPHFSSRNRRYEAVHCTGRKRSFT